MEWTREVQDALTAPFPDDEIEFLPRASANGRALALAHIDARSVMRRLDAVVGPDGWWFDFDVMSPDAKKVKGRLTVLGVTKCDAGEAAAEDEPLKAAVSDALKRCAVHFGIARYLYYLPQIWVPYDAAKRRFTETPRLAAGALERALAVCGYQGTQPEPALSAAHGNPPLRIAEPRGPRPAGDHAADSAQASGDGGPALTVETPAATANGHRPVPAARPAAPQEAAEASKAQPTAAMTCASPGCGKPLTKGQHDVSMRAFGQPLCPGCQRQQARAA